MREEDGNRKYPEVIKKKMKTFRLKMKKTKQTLGSK